MDVDVDVDVEDLLLVAESKFCSVCFSTYTQKESRENSLFEMRGRKSTSTVHRFGIGQKM